MSVVLFILLRLNSCKFLIDIRCNHSKGEHEYLLDLGFDASEEYHTYGFEWKENSITWYVDGVEKHRATENIPSNPGRIMVNAWPGIGVDNWLRPFKGDVPLTAKIKWITWNARFPYQRKVIQTE